MYGTPILLHCHTNHSDGTFTPLTLAEAAREAGYQGMALTDHNTCSGCDAYIEENIDFPMLRSMEWTTYYGHMLVFGIEEIVDWRDADLYNIDTKIAEVKAKGGLVGIAHPFDPGNPICTGCHWEFDVHNWENVDAIEIWNGEFPELSPFSSRSYALWKEKVCAGEHLFATAGRDWHRKSASKCRPAINFLGLEGNVSAKNIKEALQKGHILCSLGPGVSLKVTAEGKPIQPGDSLFAYDRICLDVQSVAAKLPVFADSVYQVKRWQLSLNDRVLAVTERDDSSRSSDLSFHFEGKVEEGALFLEAFGTVDDGPETPLVVAAPFYVIPSRRAR